MFTDAIGFLTQGALIVTAGITLVSFLIHRDRERGIVAAMFGCLSFGTLTDWVSEATGSEWAWMRMVSAVLLLGHPLSMVLLLQRFRHVQRWVILGLALGWIASAAFLILAASGDIESLPPIALAPLLVLFVGGEFYAAYGVVAGALTSRGFKKNRLSFVAFGMGLLVVTLVLASIEAALGSKAIALDVAVSLLGFIVVIAFYLGFAPPSWLRRVWRQQAVASFASKLAEGHDTEGRASLATRALADVGLSLGRVRQAWVALGPTPHWRLCGLDQDGTVTELQAGPADAEQLSALLKEGKSYSWMPVGNTGLQAHLMPQGTHALLACPLRSSRRGWGFLMLAVDQAPLFLQETVETMHLLAIQACTAYEAEEAEGKIRAANNELEAFAYSVSHDLRAPLRAIDGFARILLEDYANDLPQEARRHLGTIMDGAKEMGQMVDDLLRLSRLERQALDPRPVDTRGLVEAVVADSHSAEAARHVEVHIAELPPCMADPGLVKQVWTNLVGNAFKYTRNRKEPKVEIGWSDERGGAYYVKDNGVGFDMRHSHNLFGVFQRLNRAEDYEGTGVGLAIAKRIVQRHGGEIWAQAEPDRGATFYFSLKGGPA